MSDHATGSAVDLNAPTGVAALDEMLSEPSKYSKVMLKALQGKHVYQGNVTSRVIKIRRAKGKVAKHSRKRNRN